MNNRIILSLVFILSGCNLLSAFDYSKAETAYKNKNYEEAANLYNQAIQEEGISAGLLYNLGNCYYRLGKDGDAMVCYERAKKLDPRNSSINQNLTFLSTKVTDANKGEIKGSKGNVEPEQESFIRAVYRLITVETQSNSWAVFSVMAFILFLGGLAMYMFTPNVLARKTGFFAGLTFLGFSVVFIIFAFMGAHEYNKQDKGILLEFKTSLLSEPGSGGKETSSPLHKGTKVEVLESRKGTDGDEWMKVRLNSDNTGWVKKDGIEII